MMNIQKSKNADRNFYLALENTLGKEGLYSNDPKDLGGETVYGISRKNHPKWPGWKVVDALKPYPAFEKIMKNHMGLLELARAFYRVNFWDEIKGDYINSKDIAAEMFDTAVNMAPCRAVIFLQKALNKINKNGELFKDLAEDGEIGPGTLSILNSQAVADREGVLLKIMNVYQGSHYLEQMEKNPSQERFCIGWFEHRV